MIKVVYYSERFEGPESVMEWEGSDHRLQAYMFKIIKGEVMDVLKWSKSNKVTALIRNGKNDLVGSVNATRISERAYLLSVSGSHADHYQTKICKFH